MPKKRRVAKLTVLDSVWVACSPTTAQTLSEDLSYIDSYWIQGQFGKEKKERRVVLINKTEGSYIFYSGLLQRAIDCLKSRGIKVQIHDERREVFYDEPTETSLRDYQKEAVMELLEKGSGVVHHATGTGKSYVITGLVEAFNEENILFLVHTKDLMWQISDLLNKNNFEHTILHSSAKSKSKVSRVTVTTVQTYRKFIEEYVDYWDVILVDETHHINAIMADGKKKKYSQYADVLLKTNAPIRYGFTATLPTTEKQRLCLEALIGPVLHTYSMKEASKDGVLAKGSVEFITFDKCSYEEATDATQIYNELGTHSVKGRRKKYTKYQIVYFNCITMNTNRNIFALTKAYEHLMEGQSVLLLASQKKHIEELVRLSVMWDLQPVVVDGSTPQERRNEIKQLFTEKKEPFVIASTVWNEGVSIDTIDVCINAGGGLDEKRTLQIIGRGLRKSENKSKVKIYDFEDNSHKYLRDHTKERKRIYKEMGWLN